MRGRQRKPVLFDDRLVLNALAPQQEVIDHYSFIEELPVTALDKAILHGKSGRLSEAEIGAEIGLSRDQVKRRIKPLYDRCCALTDLRPKPMGRAPRFRM
jgi:hypothetical protein